MKVFLRTYGIFLIALFCILTGGYWYLENRSMQGVSELDATQVAKLVEVVGKHVVLPEPLDVSQVQVAGVQDAAQLMKVSQFFKDAQNGDQLLIFPTKLVLFRPSQNKIVNMSAPSGIQENASEIPSVVTSNTATTTITEVAPKVVSRTLTVEIRNGSGKTGLAGTVKTKFAAFPQLSVSKTGNAANESYENTIIVNKEGFALPDITSVLKGTTQVTLPEGEVETKADILIILGKDTQ
jgi:hypothetical protein